MIDCGLVVEMGERDHQNLVKLLGALVKKDGLLAAQYMVDTSKKCQASPREVELFKKGIQRIIDDDDDNVSLTYVPRLSCIRYFSAHYRNFVGFDVDNH
jgi:predicted unusual protein kinase regulating ubiquinone biosynthesis (AarF/ABC1/UbiB family)